MYNERQHDLLGAVLDTSVVVSGFRSKRGASAEILRLWRENQDFQLIVSDPTLVELAETLLAKNVPESIALEFLEAVHRLALVTDNTYVVSAVAQDPDDDVFLATAMEGQADYLVSLDRHLLSIKYYHGVQIVWPRDFLKFLRSNIK